MSVTKEQMRGGKGGKFIFLKIVWYSPQVNLLSWLEKALQYTFFYILLV